MSFMKNKQSGLVNKKRKHEPKGSDTAALSFSHLSSLSGAKSAHVRFDTINDVDNGDEGTVASKVSFTNKTSSSSSSTQHFYQPTLEFKNPGYSPKARPSTSATINTTTPKSSASPQVSTTMTGNSGVAVPSPSKTTSSKSISKLVSGSTLLGAANYDDLALLDLHIDSEDEVDELTSQT